MRRTKKRCAKTWIASEEEDWEDDNQSDGRKFGEKSMKKIEDIERELQDIECTENEAF